MMQEIFPVKHFLGHSENVAAKERTVTSGNN